MMHFEQKENKKTFNSWFHSVRLVSQRTFGFTVYVWFHSVDMLYENILRGKWADKVAQSPHTMRRCKWGRVREWHMRLLSMCHFLSHFLS
eukprot:SAG31_NODE_1060_length_10111_cov_17.871354_2_plen_90_part_00